MVKTVTCNRHVAQHEFCLACANSNKKIINATEVAENMQIGAKQTKVTNEVWKLAKRNKKQHPESVEQKCRVLCRNRALRDA